MTTPPHPDPSTEQAFSIWFFVGIMCLAYGIVLLPYGAWAWFGHHEAPTILNTLHPTFWWGVVLTRNLPRNSETDNWPHISTNVAGTMSQIPAIGDDAHVPRHRKLNLVRQRNIRA